jgi:hypothetical protein
MVLDSRHLPDSWHPRGSWLLMFEELPLAEFFGETLAPC